MGLNAFALPQGEVVSWQEARLQLMRGETGGRGFPLLKNIIPAYAPTIGSAGRAMGSGDWLAICLHVRCFALHMAGVQWTNLSQYGRLKLARP
jgi:hypothetical protein